MIVIFFAFSLQAFALVDNFDITEHIGENAFCTEEDTAFNDCPESVKLIHKDSVQIVAESSRWLSGPLEEVQKDEDVVALFLKYFKINLRDPAQAKLANQVLEQVKRLRDSLGDVKYTCKTDKKSLWCAGDPYALVPPPKSRIILCPAFFQLTPKLQRGVLLHEWNHFSGGRHVDYLPEAYCHSSADHSPEKLVRSSDMYMLLLHNLSEAEEELPCF